MSQTLTRWCVSLARNFSHFRIEVHVAWKFVRKLLRVNATCCNASGADKNWYLGVQLLRYAFMVAGQSNCDFPPTSRTISDDIASSTSFRFDSERLSVVRPKVEFIIRLTRLAPPTTMKSCLRLGKSTDLSKIPPVHVVTTHQVFHIGRVCHGRLNSSVELHASSP